MTRPKTPRPTDAELEILRVLWRRGPSTVREVKEDLDRTPKTGYTTVLKLMQIMTGKGHLARDVSRRTHVYRPVAAEQTTQRRLVRDLMDRAFGGSARKLVLQALAAKKASPQELDEIRKMLDEAESKSKRG